MIGIYGATGFTGRLVVQELLRAGATPVLVGRDGEALEQLAREHGGLPFRIAEVDGNAALPRALADCAAVINCAPAGLCGEAVICAALEVGTQYCDAAGEQPFIRKVFEEYGSRAARAGIALVPAVGFDYALGDCIACLAARGREPAAEVVVAYAIAGSGVGAGSLRFALETRAGGEVVFRDGAWRPVPFEVRREFFDFGPPIGRQPVARYASGEVLTVPRHTATRRVTTLITSRSLVPHPALVPFFPWLRPAVAMLRRTPLRRLLASASGRLGTPSAGDRTSARFTVSAVVRAEDGSIGRGAIEGGDFHGVTAAILAYAGRRLASADRDRRGALAPAQAFDPSELLDHLANRGVRWTLEG